MDNKNGKNYENEKKTTPIKWFENIDNSCAYDSIITIYISDLKIFIDKQNLTEKIPDKYSLLFFNYYREFRNCIIELFILYPFIYLISVNVLLFCL